MLQKEELDFLTTNRLLFAEAGAMKPSHRFGNAVRDAERLVEADEIAVDKAERTLRSCGG